MKAAKKRISIRPFFTDLADGSPAMKAMVAGVVASLPQFARHKLFDQYQRWLPRERAAAPVTETADEEEAE